MHQNPTYKPFFTGLISQNFPTSNWCTNVVVFHGFVWFQKKGLPFNHYSWLTTHNSFAKLGAKSETGSLILSPENQQDSITSQLDVCMFSSTNFFFLVSEKLSRFGGGCLFVEFNFSNLLLFQSAYIIGSHVIL